MEFEHSNPPPNHKKRKVTSTREDELNLCGLSRVEGKHLKVESIPNLHQVLHQVPIY
jgi:hypothetical protein